MVPKINEGTPEIYCDVRDGSSLEAVDCSCQAHGRDLKNVNKMQATVEVRHVEVGVEENVWTPQSDFQVLENRNVIEWISHTQKGWNSFYPCKAGVIYSTSIANNFLLRNFTVNVEKTCNSEARLLLFLYQAADRLNTHLVFPFYFLQLLMLHTHWWNTMVVPCLLAR